MKIVLSLYFLFTSYLSFSQEEFYYKTYDWKAMPDKFAVSEAEKAKDQITLFEKKFTQYYVQKDAMITAVLDHKLILLNNDKAIENNNKYYVSNYGTLEVILQKARVITPNGNIKELSSKDIQTSKDENGNVEYQYFAFEGIEVGSCIEYLQVMTFPANYAGEEVIVQSSHFKKDITHELLCPSHLEFKVKAVNGLGDFKQDTTDLGQVRYSLHLDSLEGVDDEASSAYAAGLKKYFYMLFRNNATGKSNFYNYQDVTKNIHGTLFTPMTSKEAKLLNKFISASKAKDGATLFDKVHLLETHLKSTIILQDQDFDGATDLQKILENKICNNAGATKLMLNCLRTMDVKFELVYTCDRNDLKFIPDFQGYNFLKKMMIYVNDIDAYFISDLFSRLGFPPTEYIYTDGLFIKEIKIGELVSSIGVVKRIQGKKMEDSIDEIVTDVVLDEERVNAIVSVTRKTTGYKSLYQSFLDYVDESQRKEILDEFINYIDSETKPENMSFENDSTLYYGVKPLIGKGVLKSANFMEQAGDKILFKIGMLIGPQSNLYNSKERKLPVEIDHLGKYYRKIIFKIPAGYEIKNLDKLNISVQSEYDHNTMGFVSIFELTDDVLEVKITEWYSTPVIPIAHYKEYENVINAAADFNKLVIVLQKK